MFKVHVISDLNYGYNEHTDPEDETIPEGTDLVIINGNVGHIKRSVYYSSILATKYPAVQFVFNFGEKERYWQAINKFEYELEDNLAIRIANSNDWPKNLHWKDPRTDDPLLITLKTSQVVSVFPIYGFPYIHSYTGNWEDTHWYKNYLIDTKYIAHHDWDPSTGDLYRAAELRWATKEWINQKFIETEAKVKKWELGLKNYGILVTHLNPYNDPRFKNCTVSPFKFHLDKGLWVTAMTSVNNINYLGAKLYSNPGRGKLARSVSIDVD